MLLRDAVGGALTLRGIRRHDILRSMSIRLQLLTAVLALHLAVPASAQDAPPPGGPKVGEMAPDFELPGATRTGPSQTPVRLSDYRGQTVVIAFFPKARTGG